MNKKRRVYQLVDRSELGDSEALERFIKFNLIVPHPGLPDKYIVYIGKGKPQWPKLLRDIKVKAARRKKHLARLEAMDANCVTRSYTDSTTLSKVDKDRLIKRNLKEVKRIAKHLEPLTGLPITRNTIIVIEQKNRRFCKSGISNNHLAHYHNTKPYRICFRPMFLFNPVLPTNQKCHNCKKHHMRYTLTYDAKWFKLNPTPRIKRRITPILALIDCTCHELAHHGTNNKTRRGGHDADFQKKYILLFTTMLNDIISGRYYIERVVN